MSSENQVQLKQENLVNGQVVHEDINPKTTLNAVYDNSTGASMDQVIDRIWSAINNKLSRIVNSVNGRTGVVTLYASDVGLGKVDNVSFAEIKQWVIDKLKNEFSGKTLRLFDNLSEVIQIVDLNDLNDDGTPFYCDKGINGDNRAYIGCIYLDEGSQHLSCSYKAINTIGDTDNSIIYNETVNGKDMTGGGIGVNIHYLEDALEIYNDLSGDKNKSGMRINKDKIVGRLYHFRGVYGNGTTSDENALLYFSNVPSDAKTVYITIDGGTQINGLKLRKTDLRVGDIIICQFKDYRIEGAVPEGMNGRVMFRNPAIGRVESVPSMEDGSGDYRINFYTMKTKAGMGLQYISDHDNSSDIEDEQLTIKLVTGWRNGCYNNANMSGLQVYPKDGDPKIQNFSSSYNLSDNKRYVVLPEGATKVFGSAPIVDNTFMGGIGITTDMSLCLSPYDGYREIAETIPGGEQRRSEIVENWAVVGPSDMHGNPYEHLNRDFSLVGVNLLKTVSVGDSLITSSIEEHRLKFANVSGLRITGPGKTLDTTTLGMCGEINPDDPTSTTLGESTGGVPFGESLSGGLSVNVGKFLDITPGMYQTDNTTYYDGGKVNVRLGAGLCDDGNNRISINIDQDSGMVISNGVLKTFQTGLQIIDETNNKTVSYTPNGATTVNRVMKIKLGSGLRLRETADGYVLELDA